MKNKLKESENVYVCEFEDSGFTCGDRFNCCNCGSDGTGNGCGCPYCWSCNACDSCKADLLM